MEGSSKAHGWAEAGGLQEWKAAQSWEGVPLGAHNLAYGAGVLNAKFTMGREEGWGKKVPNPSLPRNQQVAPMSGKGINTCSNKGLSHIRQPCLGFPTVLLSQNWKVNAVSCPNQGEQSTEGRQAGALGLGKGTQVG